MTGDVWSDTTLGAIAHGENGLIDGPFGSNLPASAYTESGVPVIRGSNLTLGEARFKAGEFVYVSDVTAARLARSLCQPQDIIFTKKGTIGQTGIIPQQTGHDRFLLSSNQMKLMVDKTKADSLFVYYYVSSPQSREKIVRDASITGVPKTNVAYLRAFPIRLPSLPEQRAIAHILGTLDDKIELSRRMNETLEAMARAIFKSWFVDFDPVRAKMEGRWRRGESLAGLAAHLYDLFPDRLVDSERGELPKGWSVGTIGDLCSRVIEKVEKPSEWKDALLIDLSRMPHKSLTLADWGLGEGLTTSVTRFRARDTLFGAIRPYFHKVGLAPMDGVTNVSVFVLRARNGEDWAYVLLFASSADTVEYATRVAKGTKMPVVSWQDLMKHRVPIPPEHLRAAFGRVVGPVLTRVIANTHECRTLAALRDTLLPKLISGELRVKDVERFSAKLV